MRGVDKGGLKVPRVDSEGKVNRVRSATGHDVDLHARPLVATVFVVLLQAARRRPGEKTPQKCSKLLRRESEHSERVREYRERQLDRGIDSESDFGSESHTGRDRDRVKPVD